MRLASYNVENLFDRAKIMNLKTWNDGKTVSADFAKLTNILQKPAYSTQDKKTIVTLLKALGLGKSDDAKFVTLRQNRGRLVRRGAAGLEVIAGGRADWVGWLELVTEAVDEAATRMTARVLRDVDADVLAVVEAEARPSLARFNGDVAPMVNSTPYRHVMLIDGNDERGIDVGLLTRDGYDLVGMTSHVDDTLPAGGTTFSRDCPEYKIRTPSGKTLLLLINHLKSKGYGVASASDARRKIQAERVRAIYDQRRSEGIDLIAVVGDLNDTPDSGPLAPLLQNGSDLKDIFAHPSFDDGGRPGTFGNCTKSQKIDYLLLSPALFGAVTAGGVFRKGLWGGKNGNLWEVFPELKAAHQAASDHAAVWADLNI